MFLLHFLFKPGKIDWGEVDKYSFFDRTYAKNILINGHSLITARKNKGFKIVLRKSYLKKP